MLNLNQGVKIYAYAKPTDMRKGINGLSGIVRSEFETDPTNGSLFVFINRTRDRMKMLYFESGGFWLYYRVLEAGTFESLKAASKNAKLPGKDSDVLKLDATELSMLLSGVSLAAYQRRRKRYLDSAV